jgi:hypothetical protein
MEEAITAEVGRKVTRPVIDYILASALVQKHFAFDSINEVRSLDSYDDANFLVKGFFLLLLFRLLSPECIIIITVFFFPFFQFFPTLCVSIVDLIMSFARYFFAIRDGGFAFNIPEALLFLRPPLASVFYTSSARIFR